MEREIDQRILKALKEGVICVYPDPKEPFKEGYVTSVDLNGVYANTLPKGVPADELPLEAEDIYYPLSSYGKTWALDSDELL
ncbi:MAG: hypothetical protein LKJ88_00625 [Bacilli bacterium]|jgi:hypothetical protein|nr:hypothetical protein [Bacilli bacterium]